MKKTILFLSVFFISLISIAQVQIDSVVVTDETCPGNCDGTLTIYTSGGTAPEMYDIGGAPQTSNVFTGLCASTYTVTVNDALPSSDNTTATVASPTPLTFSLSTFNCSAYGICDGQATVTISGGTPPYTITYNSPLQSGPQTSYINLCAGNYTVSVTDANSCPGTGPTGSGPTSFTITQPPPPPLGVIQNLNPVSCDFFCDGSSDLIVNGGVPPYTYSWGTWTLGGFCDGDPVPAWTVTDAIGQQVSGPSQNLFFSGPQATPVVNAHESCPGACDGEVEATSIFGDHQPFTFAINGGPSQSNPIFSNMCPGTYNLVVINAYGCSYGYPFTINATTSVVSTANFVSDPTSIGACDGVANGFASGGTPGYTYQWVGCSPTVFSSTPSATPTINTLCAGDYQLITTDANGCSDSSNCITITDPITTAISTGTTGINKIYPNPTSGIIHMELSNNIVFPQLIEVIDIHGKKVQEKVIHNNKTVINISSLPKGIYVLKSKNLLIKHTIVVE